MEEILATARTLGKQMAQHARTQAFTDAARAVAADPDAQTILRRYQEHKEKVMSAEMQGTAIDAGERRRLSELESQMASNAALNNMIRRQADYVEMMHQVQAAIDEEMER